MVLCNFISTTFRLILKLQHVLLFCWLLEWKWNLCPPVFPNVGGHLNAFVCFSLIKKYLNIRCFWQSQVCYWFNRCQIQAFFFWHSGVFLQNGLLLLAECLTCVRSYLYAFPFKEKNKQIKKTIPEPKRDRSSCIILNGRAVLCSEVKKENWKKRLAS